MSPGRNSIPLLTGAGTSKELKPHLGIITAGRAGGLHKPPLGPITSRAYRLTTEFPLHGAPCRHSNSCRVLLHSFLKFLPFSLHRFSDSSLRSDIFSGHS